MFNIYRHLTHEGQYLNQAVLSTKMISPSPSHSTWAQGTSVVVAAYMQIMKCITEQNWITTYKSNLTCLICFLDLSCKCFLLVARARPSCNCFGIKPGLRKVHTPRDCHALLLVHLRGKWKTHENTFKALTKTIDQENDAN